MLDPWVDASLTFLGRAVTPTSQKPPVKSGSFCVVRGDGDRPSSRPTHSFAHSRVGQKHGGNVRSGGSGSAVGLRLEYLQRQITDCAEVLGVAGAQSQGRKRPPAAPWTGGASAATRNNAIHSFSAAPEWQRPPRPDRPFRTNHSLCRRHDERAARPHHAARDADEWPCRRSDSAPRRPGRTPR